MTDIKATVGNNIKKYINKLPNSKLNFITLIIILSFVANLVFGIVFIIKNYELKQSRKKYTEDINRVKKQYSTLYLRNANTKKQLQNLDLKLSAAINSTENLKNLLSKKLDEEDQTIDTYRKELLDGLIKANNDIKAVWKSMNKLFYQSKYDINEYDKKKDSIYNRVPDR